VCNQPELPATRCDIYLAELYKNVVVNDVFCIVGHVTLVLKVSLRVDGRRELNGSQFIAQAR